VICTEIDHGLDLNVPTEGYVRTPGLHMSDIYNSLYKDLDPKRFGGEGGPDQAKMSVGTGFEELLAKAMAERILGERPPEFAVMPDGETIVPVGTPGSIIFSPDHFLYEDLTRLGEFKATWMSISKGIQDKRFDKWYCQMKSYGKPLKMPDQRLYVLFVNGDYSYKPPHGGCSLRAWDVRFTQRELDSNWNTLMRHARKKGML
jgi:hypothetical protein